MRKSFNGLLKSLEKEQPLFEDDCIALEYFGDAARVQTAGGPPDPAFAAFHEALMQAFWAAKEIVLDPGGSPTRK